MRPLGYFVLVLLILGILAWLLIALYVLPRFMEVYEDSEVPPPRWMVAAFRVSLLTRRYFAFPLLLVAGLSILWFVFRDKRVS